MILERLLSFHGADQLAQSRAVSTACQGAAIKYVSALQNTQDPANVWAMQMLDANDLFPGAGLLEGNLYNFPGYMHECLEAKSPEGDIQGKYWLISTAGGETNPLLSLGFLRVGRCFPHACTNEDVRAVVDAYLDLVTKTSNTYHSFVLDSHEKDEKISWNNADVFMMVFISLIFFLVFVSTMVDVLATVYNVRISDKLLVITQGFSLYTNTIRVFDTNVSPSNENNLSCLNGLRAISISWVVLGHTLFEMSPLGMVTGKGASLKNGGTFREDGWLVDDFFMTPCWNGISTVDTFFLIGALLLAFHTLREMDKLQGKSVGKWILFWAMFYVHRYIRLTAVYSIVLGLHATLLKLFTTGPSSFLVSGLVNQCQNGWWLNLLYINNFVSEIQEGTGKNLNCMGWTWYLANDMQFFVITPFILYALWKNFPLGIGLSSGLLFAATATPFALTHKDESQFYHGDQETFYKKPWNRFQPYVMGLVLGYLLHKLKSKKIPRFHTLVNLAVWLVAAVLACATVYGPTKANILKDVTVSLPISPDYPSRAERSTYNGFSKISWSLAVCWVILACVKGRGGAVNAFLSWGLWIPIARLSYCIYLIQYTVIFWYNSQLDFAFNYSNAVFAYTVVGNFAMCCFVALLLVVLFEYPLAHMEKLLFAALGVGRMPRVRKSASSKEQNDRDKKENKTDTKL